MLLKRIPLLAWFIVPTIILVIGGVWFFTKDGSSTMEEGTDLKVEKVDKPVEGTVEYKVESRHHVPTGTNVTNYNSNPPNSGDHWEQSVKNGVYEDELPDEQIVHSLEHGYVWISYLLQDKNSEATDGAQLIKGLSDDDKKALEGLVRQDDWKILMAPREANDSTIALVVWGRVLKMDSLNLDQVGDFIKTYRDRGPEKTPE